MSADELATTDRQTRAGATHTRDANSIVRIVEYSYPEGQRTDDSSFDNLPVIRSLCWSVNKKTSKASNTTNKQQLGTASSCSCCSTHSEREPSPWHRGVAGRTLVGGEDGRKLLILDEPAGWWCILATSLLCFCFCSRNLPYGYIQTPGR